MKAKFLASLTIPFALLLPLSLFAQVAEINPYGGFYWPSMTSGIGTFQNNQLWGVRGGYYVTENFEIGGNYSWSNHFQPKNSVATANFAGALGFPQGKVHANIWEAEFTYNFGKRNLFGSTAIKPYLTGGLGGLTTTINDPSSFVLNVRQVVTPDGNAFFVANDALHSSDTFLTFSYGGGLKAERLWGPMGVFGDIRGRSIPNFFTSSIGWPELTGGLTFSWGEK